MKQLEELVAAISHRVAETMSSQLRLRYYDFGDKFKNNMMMVLQKGEKNCYACKNIRQIWLLQKKR